MHRGSAVCLLTFDGNQNCLIKIDHCKKKFGLISELSDFFVTINSKFKPDITMTVQNLSVKKERKVPGDCLYAWWPS